MYICFFLSVLFLSYFCIFGSWRERGTSLLYFDGIEKAGREREIDEYEVDETNDRR